MAKTIQLQRPNGEAGGWLIECPACGYGHLFDERWTFNGDAEMPTFRASMLVYEQPEYSRPRCHSFVTNGKIQYLNDSTHALAGKTVELPDID